MGKRERQQKILALIGREAVGTQGDLARVLASEGMVVTQATISRDVRELGLVKATDRHGRQRYRAPAPSDVQRGQWTRLVRRSVRSVTPAGHMVVVRTPPAMAEDLGEALDGLRLKGLLGVFPHGQSVLLVGSDADAALHLSETIREICR